MTENSNPSAPASQTTEYQPIFMSTEWTVVLAASDSNPNSAKALETLCQNYYPALRAYLLLAGHSPNDADDLLQSFFAYFLDRKIYQEAAPERGQFRCFILKVLKHFIIDEHRKKRAQKRGGDVEILSLPEDDEHLVLVAANGDIADLAFDKKWAMATVQIALERLQRECEALGRTELFQALKARLMDDSDTATPYATLSTKLGKSEDALRKDASRLRQRFHRLLYETVQATLLPEVSVESELEYLLHCLTR